MPPVAELIDSAAGEAENVPPVYAPVPVKVTDWAVVILVQKEEAGYEIAAVGAVVIVTVVVALIAEQPPAAPLEYVTVYVPAVLLLGVMAPVELLIVSPAGDEEKVPPV